MPMCRLAAWSVCLPRCRFGGRSDSARAAATSQRVSAVMHWLAVWCVQPQTSVRHSATQFMLPLDGSEKWGCKVCRKPVSWTLVFNSLPGLSCGTKGGISGVILAAGTVM